MEKNGRLRGNGIAATVMSNLALERYLQGIGITLKRTPVGDRYVVEEMRQSNFNLGGEQSGHIIMTDYMTTGDGLVASLQFLSALVVEGKPASELLNKFEPLPQMIKNVRYSREAGTLESDQVKRLITASEKKLGNDGRLLIRKSGTEPLLRIMAEHYDKKLVEEIVEDIGNSITNQNF